MGDIQAGGGPIPPRCDASKLSPSGKYRYRCTLPRGHPPASPAPVADGAISGDAHLGHRWSNAERVAPDLTDATAVASWLDEP